MQERSKFRPQFDRLEDRAVPAGLPFGGAYFNATKEFVQSAVSNVANALGDQIGKVPQLVPDSQAALGVPQTTQGYVNKVNTTLLGSPASPTPAPFYSPATGGFTIRWLGVMRTLRSEQYTNAYVTSQYQEILGRAPDSTGLTTHANPLRLGADLKSTTMSLITSDEFYQKSGGTSTGYVTNVFQTLLGHPPSTSDLNTLTTALNNGTMTREQVAGYVIYSTEYETLQVTEMYQTLLGRDPDPAGLEANVAYLVAGGREQALMREIMLGAEFTAGT